MLELGALEKLIYEALSLLDNKVCYSKVLIWEKSHFNNL